MSESKFEVLLTSQARSELTSVVQKFRKEGLSADPVLFGSHRKPEAAIISIELYEKLFHQIEEILFDEMLKKRIADPSPRLTFDELLSQIGMTLEDLQK